LEFAIWNLRPARSCPRPPRLAWLAGELAMAGGFICNLPARRSFGGVLGICDFRHQTPRQSRRTLAPAMRDGLGPSKIPFRGEGPGFSGQNEAPRSKLQSIQAKGV